MLNETINDVKDIGSLYCVCFSSLCISSPIFSQHIISGTRQLFNSLICIHFLELEIELGGLYFTLKAKAACEPNSRMALFFFFFAIMLLLHI